MRVLSKEVLEMNGKEMISLASKMSLVGLCILGAMLSPAKADQGDQKTIFTFSDPVEVPGRVLDAGTYVFTVMDVQGDRDIVQVSNKRGDKLYGTFLTIPDYRAKPTGKPVITFDERAANSPEAVKVWFYPGETYGHEFVYPKAKAVQLAKANKTAVPSMPDELAANTTQPAATKDAQSVVAMKQASLKAQKPNDEEVEIAEVFEVPPAGAGELPKTASLLPLVGLLGFLSLGMAFWLRLAVAKIK
jgi:hypothetical protein